jgi:hypothetical protein
MESEFGYPVSLYTHLHAQAVLELPSHYVDIDFLLRLEASATHQVTERFHLRTAYNFIREGGGVTSHGVRLADIRTLDHRVSGSFIYFIEDQIRINTTINYDHTMRDYYPVENTWLSLTSNLTSGWSLTLGCSYNIL